MPICIFLLANFNYSVKFWILREWKLFYNLQLSHVHTASLFGWFLIWAQSHAFSLGLLFLLLSFPHFPVDKNLLVEWPLAAEVVVEELDPFSHVTKFDKETDFLICLPDMLQSLELVFNIHLVKQIIHFLIAEVDLIFWVNTLRSSVEIIISAIARHFASRIIFQYTICFFMGQATTILRQWWWCHWKIDIFVCYWRTLIVLTSGRRDPWRKA